LLELWSLAVNREEDWGEVEPAFHTARVRLAAALHDRSGVDVDQTTPTEEDSPTTISVPMGSVTKYASVFAFVRAWVAPTFARHDLDVAGQNFKWCSQWFSHPEAVFGFSEAWRHYEALNATGEAMDDWLVQVFYPLLDRLTSGSGTFSKCKHDHLVPDPLPVDSGEQEDPAPHAP
ncbi:MAG: DUF4913 domain-containing protein, partial [Propionibacterium sp.]|nr:DUF4913 domain-containing protein [Propionibacterium sp.]